MNHTINFRPYRLIIFSLFFTNCGEASESIVLQDTNSIPSAVNDVLSVQENSTAGVENHINVGSNDSIGNDGGDSDNFMLHISAQNGIVNEVNDGVFEYIPNKDFLSNVH